MFDNDEDVALHCVIMLSLHLWRLVNTDFLDENGMDTHNFCYANVGNQSGKFSFFRSFVIHGDPCMVDD